MGRHFECCDNAFIVTVCVRLSDGDVILSDVTMRLLQLCVSGCRTVTSFCFECCDNVFIVTVCVRLSDSDVFLF